MKNKIILLSLPAIVALYGVELEKIEVQESSTSINNISREQIKSIDLAQTLSKKSASIELVRASSVNNDIIIRGQKKDNITVTIDGAKVCNACPNRMDPPISHVSSDYVESIEIKKGPFDVSNFGGLSAAVKVKTIMPKEDLEGKVFTEYGSFDYAKGGLYTTGGNKKFQALIGYTYEQSGQYLDGNGSTMSQQTDNLSTMPSLKYSNTYKDALAYKKQTAITKANLNITTNQTLQASLIYNKADDVLYPSRSMDADTETSMIFNSKYIAKNLSNTLSKKFMINYYNSQSTHPMSVTKRAYTLSSTPIEKINETFATIQGGKIENSFDIGAMLLVGYDMSIRTWNATIKNKAQDSYIMTSIPDTNTTNHAIYSKLKKKLNNFDLKAGARYDYTTITTDKTATIPSSIISTNQDKNYNNYSANIITTYYLDNHKIYVGIGQSTRVPDAVELYTSMKNSTPAKSWLGNDELNPTINKEIDLGAELILGDSIVAEISSFYSYQKDFIYTYKSSNGTTYTNLNAIFYGADISLKAYILDELTLNSSVAYTYGQKQQAITNQTDLDMADVRPLKALVSLDYKDDRYFGSLGGVYVASDSDIDSDNGEVVLNSYYLLDTKVGAKYRDFKLTVGIDNILDTTYKSTNSYIGTKLITNSSSQDNYVLNDMGRFIYTKLEYSF